MPHRVSVITAPRPRRLYPLLALALTIATGCGEGTILEPDLENEPSAEYDGGAPGKLDNRDAGSQSTPSVQRDSQVATSPGAQPSNPVTGSLPSGERDAGAPVAVRSDAAALAPPPPAPPSSKPDTDTVVTPPGSTPSAPPAKSAASYYVENGKIYDVCGEELIMRGVNHPTIYTDRSGAAFPDIARTGSNVVRLFWYGGNGISINELEPAINKAVANGMVPMLEMHDSTGKWNLDPIINMWTNTDALALIKRHQKHILVNIANEATPADNNQFAAGYKTAIQRMRAAGIHVPLVIDGGRWGRDYEMLLAKGRELLDFDPDHNLIMSAHLYDPLSTAQYADMFARAKAQQLPFIVGEFANREPPGCGRNIDYGALINEANKAGIGWLAWSWGDNNSSTNFNTDCAEFDMTSTFAYDSLQGWGRDVAINHAASIQKTAKRPYALTHGDVCK